MKIKIITTGGTIDKLYFDQLSKYKVGTPQIDLFLQEANVTCEYEVVSLLRKDSLDMEDRDRAAIRDTISRDGAQRFVVTHGTDTMLATAETLRTIPQKTIVLTGAMQPASFRGTDAIFNIGFAFAAAQLLAPGVYVAMNGRVFEAGTARKNREMNRFESLPPS